MEGGALGVELSDRSARRSSVMTSSTKPSGAHGSGEYAPMPPVLGPVSPFEDALVVLRGAQWQHRGAVAHEEQRDLLAGEELFDETRRPAAGSCSAWASAAARSSVTMTPLPAASPSALTTCGGAEHRRARASASASVPARTARPVGTPAASMMRFANVFDPSSCAAAAPGPNTAIPRRRTASATPATSGASGPMMSSSMSLVDAVVGDDGALRRVERDRRHVGRDARVAGSGRDLRARRRRPLGPARAAVR